MVFKNNRFTKPTVNNCGPTRFLYLSCDGLQNDTISLEALTEIFSKFGELDYSNEETAIELIPNRRFCFICYTTVASATSAIEHFNQEGLESNELISLFGAKIVLKYAIERVETKPPPEPECTSLTDHVEVPGLYLLNNYITEEEEKALLEEFGGPSAPWKESLQRRVQVCYLLLILFC